MDLSIDTVFLSFDQTPVTTNFKFAAHAGPMIMVAALSGLQVKPDAGPLVGVAPILVRGHVVLGAELRRQRPIGRFPNDRSIIVERPSKQGQRHVQAARPATVTRNRLKDR
jgi:hypothetical protein